VSGAVRTDIIDIDNTTAQILKKAGMSLSNKWKNANRLGDTAIKMDIRGLNGQLQMTKPALENEL
jgi:hypothetical protein